MSVFVTQTYLVVNLDTGESLASATNAKIIWKKPSGTSGSWDGTISGNTISYQILDDDTVEYGNWKFQSYFEIGGQKAYGKIVSQLFERPLKIIT